MQISDVLSKDGVLPEFQAENKRQLLEKLAEVVAGKVKLDKNSVFEAIWERENLGSTGYGNGVAFPHARLPGVKKVITFFVRLSKPIDYDAIDGKPVDLVALLISSENSGDDHLQTLSAFSQALKKEDVCKTIRGAKSAYEIYTALQ